jgi:hypothetical protein
MKAISVIAGVSVLAIIGILIHRSAQASTDTYECAFCNERFGSEDALAEVTEHMEGHIQQCWGQTGAPGWIPEDVNKDGVINVLDMIKIGQQNWTLVPLEEGIYKIVF